MNIITFLLKKFCLLEKNKLISIILLSIIINVIYINVISFITANIIQCIQKKDKLNTYKYFKYFILLSIFFILCYALYKFLQNINKIKTLDS
jgi:Na+-driven multidrug efflux pump